MPVLMPAVEPTLSINDHAPAEPVELATLVTVVLIGVAPLIEISLKQLYPTYTADE